jgi:predicted phosphodiesterase
MKIAVLADIHANFPALCAAVRNAENRRTHRFIVAGDLIGRGPNPVEVIRFLKERSYPAITGNMERRLLLLMERKKTKKAASPKAHFALFLLRRGFQVYSWSMPEQLVPRLMGILVAPMPPLSLKGG